MTLDRAELTGASAALVFHVALIAALSMSLASVASAPEPPAMEVELVEEVGLQAAAPRPLAPPPPSQAPQIGEAEPTQAAPAIRPAPAPGIEPAPARPQPRAPAREAPRVSRIGDDFLKGIAEAKSSERSAEPAAARFDARAKASIGALFQRLVQPCANKQINPGEGANRIRVTVNLRLRRNGSLAGASVVRVSGVDDENERYEERVRDLATAVYRECSPFSGLPPELYRTPEGGWSNINLTYKLP